MKPFTPMRRSGAISNGREKRARRGVALEFIEERSCFRREMPSPVVEFLVAVAECMIGASGSEGEDG